MDPVQPICPSCGTRSRTSDFCSNCSLPLVARQTRTAVTSPPPAPLSLPGEALASLLTILALAILVVGLLSATYVWSNYGTISTSAGLFSETASVENPFAKLAAFGIAANSVTWSALLGGVSRAIRNTIELSRQLNQLGAKTTQEGSGKEGSVT